MQDIKDIFEIEKALFIGKLPIIVSSYIHEATSQNTRKSYQSDIRHYMQDGGLLPASPHDIISYLEKHALNLNVRTLERRLTALKNWHTYQGFSDPTSLPAVRKTLTGIKKVHGKPKKKAKPLEFELVYQINEKLGNSNHPVDLRNNALILLGFFGAFRRSELVSLQLEQLNFVKEGLEITILYSKTDIDREGQIIAIPYGNEKLCPVKALRKWLEIAEIQKGPVFRKISKGRQIGSSALTSQSVNLILKSLFLEKALEISGHSLRRGFATTASKAGASFESIKRQGRWQHDATVLGYMEEGKRFEGNAAAVLLKKD